MRHVAPAFLLTTCLACAAPSAAQPNPGWALSFAEGFGAPGGGVWQPFPSAAGVAEGVGPLREAVHKLRARGARCR